MDSKLQELTKKIYKEGVQKAQTEADSIINDANDKAEKIIKDARKEAEAIKIKAKNDAEQLRSKIESEIKLAGNQAISSIKQEIIEIISSKALSSNVKGSLKDEDFIKKMISEIIGKWDPKSKSLDLNVILPEKSKKSLLDYFNKKAKNILDSGVELKFENRMEEGFKIGPKDGSFILSFTDKDFERFFQSFLKPKTKEILFP